MIYGPHVGLSETEIGKVEREGVTLNDICCRSAIEAANSVIGGSTGIDLNSFTDMQQGAVQNLIRPLADDFINKKHI